MMLAAVLAALAGCNRGQSASAQVLTRADAGGFLIPTFTIDAGKIQLTTPGRDAGMQLTPPTGQPPGTVPNPYPPGTVPNPYPPGTAPNPYPPGGGTIPR
jgi:hypothetical protein